MRTIGLDLSLTGTGVALPSEKTLLIKPRSLRGVSRLVFIRDIVAELLATSAPELAVVEDYARSPGNENPKAELHGIIQALLYDYGVPFALVHPSTLKKYATGRGDSKKEDMKLFAFKQFGREFASNDECDAFFLRAMGVEWSGTALPRNRDTKAFAEARAKSLARITWPVVSE